MEVKIEFIVKLIEAGAAIRGVVALVKEWQAVKYSTLVKNTAFSLTCCLVAVVMFST